MTTILKTNRRCTPLSIIITLLVALSFIRCTFAFVSTGNRPTYLHHHIKVKLHSSASSYNNAAAKTASSSSSPPPYSTTPTNTALTEYDLECTAPNDVDPERSRLKRDLLQFGASYNRGYGASSKARDQVLRIISRLEQLNTERYATRGIEGNNSGNTMSVSSMTRTVTLDLLNASPLKGPWRMIWTTALDVLSLEASPVFNIGAIYQVFDPPIVTNIIDFQPRIQSLFPPNLFPNSLLRARVTTRASSRPGVPNRVGLVFERVQLQPLQLLGVDIDVFPPLAVDLPRLPGVDNNNPDSPGYFDVTYLDDELLIIRQNEPGGLFALVKVDSTEA